MFKIKRHIINYGTAKLQILIIFVIGSKLSFTHPNIKTTITAIFNVLEPFKQLKGFIFLCLFITSTF